MNKNTKAILFLCIVAAAMFMLFSSADEARIERDIIVRNS